MSNFGFLWRLAAAANALMLLPAAPADAQLTPERLYYGINRAIPMTFQAPPPTGDAPLDPQINNEPLPPPLPFRAPLPTHIEIRLLEPPTWRTVGSAAVSGADDGRIDLAALFPTLWTVPAQDALVQYAQLVIDGRKTGPAVVLQPMLTPRHAARLDRAGAPMFPPERGPDTVYSGIRAYVDQVVELDTSKGKIVVALRPDAAPNTCAHFRALVAGGMYTGVVVHRIASLVGRPEADIIQTGDPNGNGQGGCGEFFDLEPSSLPHDFGVVSMARFADPNSASSQFMIALNRDGTSYLDRRYSSFGVVTAGAAVVRAMGASPVGADNRPADPPVINSAKLVDAPPAGEGPAPEKDPTKRGLGGR